jgi:hypothetical protein
MRTREPSYHAVIAALWEGYKEAFPAARDTKSTEVVDWAWPHKRQLQRAAKRFVIGALGDHLRRVPPRVK